MLCSVLLKWYLFLFYDPLLSTVKVVVSVDPSTKFGLVVGKRRRPSKNAEEQLCVYSVEKMGENKNRQLCDGNVLLPEPGK